MSVLCYTHYLRYQHKVNNKFLNRTIVFFYRGARMFKPSSFFHDHSNRRQRRCLIFHKKKKGGKDGKRMGESQPADLNLNEKFLKRYCH